MYYCMTNVGLNLLGNSDWRLGIQCAKKLKDLEEKKRGDEIEVKIWVLTTKHKQISILSSSVRLFCIDKTLGTYSIGYQANDLLCHSFLSMGQAITTFSNYKISATLSALDLHLKCKGMLGNKRTTAVIIPPATQRYPELSAQDQCHDFTYSAASRDAIVFVTLLILRSLNFSKTQHSAFWNTSKVHR